MDNLERNRMDGVLTEKEILSPGYINLKNPKFIEKDSNNKEFIYYELERGSL